VSRGLLQEAPVPSTAWLGEVESARAKAAAGDGVLARAALHLGQRERETGVGGD